MPFKVCVGMLEGPIIETDTSEVNSCKDFFVCVFKANVRQYFEMGRVTWWHVTIRKGWHGLRSTGIEQLSLYVTSKRKLLVLGINVVYSYCY